MLLNLKKLLSEAEKKNRAENFGYFEKDLFFSKDEVSSVFRVFRPEANIC